MNKKAYKITSIIVISFINAVLVATLGIAVYCGISFSKPIITDMVFQTPKSSTNGSDYDFNARIFTPRDGMPTHPVIIVSHGYNSTMENCEDVAEYYGNKGFAVIVFDFVGGSRNSSTSIHSSEMTAFTEITDYEIVLDYVEKNDAYDNNNIFISGQSFGGLIATVVAEKHKDEIKGVVLFYPAFYMADYASEVLKNGPTENIRNSGPNDISYDNGQLYDWDNLLVSEKYLTELSQIGIRDKIRALNKDVIVLQGDIDEDVTLDSTNYFIQFFPSAELVVIKDGEHGFFDKQLEQAEKASTRFMKDRL